MPRKSPSPEEIVAKLRQVDVLVSQGKSIAGAVRSIVGQTLAFDAPKVAHGRLIRLVDATMVPKAGAVCKTKNKLWRIHSAFDLPSERHPAIVRRHNPNQQLDKLEPRQRGHKAREARSPKRGAEAAEKRPSLAPIERHGCAKNGPSLRGKGSFATLTRLDPLRASWRQSLFKSPATAGSSG